MSLFGRSLIRSSLFKISSLSAKQNVRLINRNLIVLSNNKGHSESKHSLMCSCGCNGRGMHTSGKYNVYIYFYLEFNISKEFLLCLVSEWRNSMTSLGSICICHSHVMMLLNLTKLKINIKSNLGLIIRFKLGPTFQAKIF